MKILLSLIRSHHFLSPAILIFVSSAVSVLTLILDSILDTIAASIVHSKLDYCNSLYYNLSKSQINRLQQIQNCLARTVVKASKSIEPSDYRAVTSYAHSLIQSTNKSTCRSNSLSQNYMTF